MASGVVYVGSVDHNLYALDALTGTKLWSFTTGDSVNSAPAVGNGVVYLGSLDGNAYALNARTGALLWSYPIGEFVWSSPAVVNGVLYIGSDNDNAYAFGLHNGDEGKREGGSSRPDPRTLRPDFSLKVSQPIEP